MDERPQQVGPPRFGEEDPPAREGYMLSQEVEDVAHALVNREARFQHIDRERIVMGYALQTGKKPEGKGGIHVLAKAVKAPALWRDLGDFEVVIWANELAWVGMPQRAREALIAHELSHVGERTESGAVYMLEHDIEEFAWVVRTYGQWHSGLEHFAEQLGLGIEAAKKRQQP